MFGTPLGGVRGAETKKRFLHGLFLEYSAFRCPCKRYNDSSDEKISRYGTIIHHDGGIDGYATLKLNPFVNTSVYFQCKRYTGTVPTEKVQAFIGVMETNKRSVEKGLLITTGNFAKAALYIEKNNIKLELIDGQKLVKMFEEVELGVKPKTIYEPDMTFFNNIETRNNCKFLIEVK